MNEERIGYGTCAVLWLHDKVEKGMALAKEVAIKEGNDRITGPGKRNSGFTYVMSVEEMVDGTSDALLDI